jgi:WD40 repeat protein
MSTVTNKKRKALSDDASEECDRAPVIPTNVISVVLSFVQDRTTWNSLCSANKEVYKTGMGMTPPWPETKFKLGQDGFRCLKFSPCGSFLASGDISPPYLLSICDRRGRLTRLIGHTSSISDLSFSKDGRYLASAAYDTSIRIWPTNSTGLPEQSDKKLQGHRPRIQFFDFAPDDSNILVSVDYTDINVWNVETEVCTHHLDYSNGPYRTIRSMFVHPAGEKDHKCIFVTSDGKLIRTCWDDYSGAIASDIVDMPGLGQVVHKSTFSHCGSLLAASSYRRDMASHIDVTLYDMKTMSVVQRVTIDDCIRGPFTPFAFSPNGNMLVFDVGHSESLVFQVDDLNIRRRLIRQDGNGRVYASAIAFDPCSQFVAFAWSDNCVRFWTL